MLLFDGLGAWGVLVLRIFVGVIFIYHGFPKIRMPHFLAGAMGKSKAFVFLLGLGEFFSGILLILGLYTEIAALFIALVMLGAWWHKQFKWKIPFSDMSKMGWEFDLVLLGAAVALLLIGAGGISLDYMFGIWP